eukprot:7382313-Prymnesium_polylepis.1
MPYNTLRVRRTRLCRIDRRGRRTLDASLRRREEPAAKGEVDALGGAGGGGSRLVGKGDRAL